MLKMRRKGKQVLFDQENPAQIADWLTNMVNYRLFIHKLHKGAERRKDGG